MKTAYNTNLKDNVAAATVLTATFIAIMVSIVTSNDARADKATQMPAPQMEVHRLETMIITAPRIGQVVRMGTMVVTASRRPEEASKLLVAAK